MAEDITVLGLAVDSTQVVTAAEALERMAASGVHAEGAATRLEAALEAMVTETRGINAGVQSLIAIGNAAASSANNVNAASNALRSHRASLAATGVSSGQAANQTLQLSNQLQDFFVQVQAGGSPLTAFIQQGSQLTAVYGGFGAALKGVGALFTPITVGAGAAAAAVGAIALAAYQGQQQTKAFENALTLSGNAAGLTADSFKATAKAAADLTKTTIGSSKEVVTALASTGQVGPQAIGSVTAAILEYSKVSGKSLDEVTKDFASIGNGAAAFAIKQNASLNFLTDGQLRYIKSLESQGRADEAAKFAADALTTTLLQREKPLSDLEKKLQDGKLAWSEYWDHAADLGRPVTVEDRLNAATAALERARKVALNDTPDASAQVGSVPTTTRRRGTLPRQSTASDAVAKALTDRDVVAQESYLNAEATADAAAKIEAQRDKDLRDSASYQSAQTALFSAGISARFALQEAALEKDRINLDQSYQTAQVDLSAYMDKRYAIESAGLKQREAVINADIALEKQRKPSTPQDVIQQETKLVELASRRYDIEAARAKLEQQRQNYELTPARLIERAESPEDAFRRSEIKALPATDQASQQRIAASIQAAADLRANNERLNVSLIKDDQARGQAQIALEVDVLKKRLDLSTTDDGARRQAADALANYQLARQKQLNEQLKPEFQKALEGYANTAKLTRDSYDEFGSGFIKTGEDVWANFAKTGKLSISTLKDFVVEEYARVNFRKIIGGLDADGGVQAAIGKLFTAGTGLKPTSTASDAIQAAATTAKAADNQATATHTITVTASKLAIDNMTTSAIAASAALAATAAAAGSSGLAGIFKDFTLGGSSPSGGGILASAAGVGLGAGVDVSDLLFGSIFHRAAGGPISAGSAYEVGERGPEILSSAGRNYLLPGAAGTVTPNDQLGGGDVHINATYKIGQGVSRAEVVSAVSAANEKLRAEILRSKRTGGAFS